MKEGSKDVANEKKKIGGKWMSVIAFCGATGLMFRGKYTGRVPWKLCQEPERPPEDSEGFSEHHPCYTCPMYLESVRNSRYEPYRWFSPATEKGVDARRWVYGIIVTCPHSSLTKKKAMENRQKCGELVRAQLRAEQEKIVERRRGVRKFRQVEMNNEFTKDSPGVTL